MSCGCRVGIAHQTGGYILYLSLCLEWLVSPRGAEVEGMKLHK